MDSPLARTKDLLRRITPNRIIRELPLVLVLILLLWAQYTISISLVVNYLILSRRHIWLAVLLWLPFNLFWLSTLINLWKCIVTGPGWVLKSPSTNAGTSYYSQDIESQHFQSHKIHQSRPPRNSQLDSEQDNFSEDLEELSDPEEELQGTSSVPLLSQRSTSSSRVSPRGQDDLSSSTSRHPTQSRNHLSPRPALTSSSPPSYLADHTTLPASNLSFQEQVQRQRQSPPSELLNALNFPPYSSPSGASRLSHIPEPSDRVESLMCKSDGSLRYCRKCELYKADRSHHCSSCGRCVLRMDHHCPWLGGRCVGLKNHKFFILFLISSSITSFLAALAAGKGLMDFVSNARISPSDPFQLAPLNWAFLLLVGGLFGMVLTGFTFYHLYLISVNRTTIENMERSVRIRPTGTSDPSESYALLRTTRLRTFEGAVGAAGPHPGDLVGADGQFMSGDSPQVLDGAGAEPGDAGGARKLPSYNLPIYKSDDQLSRLERRKLEAGATKLNLFDLGSTLANFRQIFGVHSPAWQWFLPLHPRGISDGYQYPINPHNLHKLIQLTSEIRLLPNERSNELRFERP
ncbi:hypothetical protein PCANC_04646 [Puccinia coronata f. sp. avenae]|uniref:Palmitoyltransferase n=1 Tax=Puccinia coronata f. sp. avenae TaxID=200324 RepID=A0A2N5W0J2_9BASI|nr:hypothetical protein PCANC_04646 [Puccinia coronata f. sp. avenae]